MRRLAENLETMESCYERQDADELAALAHWLKGSAGMVGFADFGEPARNLETLAREAKWSEIEPSLHEI